LVFIIYGEKFKYKYNLMTFVYIEPSESLLTKLSQLYIKYISVRQISSDDQNQIGPTELKIKTNKFNLIFDEIAENINMANLDNLNTILCTYHKQRYIDGLNGILTKDKKFLKMIEGYQTQRTQEILTTKIELIEHLISFINTFTYNTLTSPDTCRTNYYLGLIGHITKLKDIVKDKAIPLIYENIKGDISQIINEQKIEKIKEANMILLEDKSMVSNQLSKELEKYINDMLEIPEEITDDKKYLLSELEKKYKEFLSITNQNFTQEIKNKIKKSVVELVFAEIKIQKRLNLKKPLLVTNTLTDFFAI